MKRLEQIKPAVELAAKQAELPLSKRGDDPFPVGFDGDAWVWTWRHEKDTGIAEVSVTARPEAQEGAEIRVSAGAWTPQRRDVAASRLFYSHFFDPPPARDVLVNELGPALKNAWQSALTMVDQLPQIENSRTEFLALLKMQGWLVE